MIDRMTYSSLDNTHRIPHFRAAVACFAFAGLLSNILFAAALSVAAGWLDWGSDPLGSQLCSASPIKQSPDKKKPGFPLDHCSVCLMQAPLPSGPQAGFVLADEAASGAHRPLSTTSFVVPPRHGKVQARAPPPAA
jgi:hypothetical protein